MKHKIIFSLFACLLGLSLTAGMAKAEPSVQLSGSEFRIKEAVTDDIMAAIAKDIPNVKPADLKFAFSRISKVEDIDKICKAYPAMAGLTISAEKELTSLAPLSQLSNLSSLYIMAEGVADFSPLSGLTTLTSIVIKSGKGLGPDLKWMSNMSKLTRIDIEAGAKLVSFEGIPSLPNLREATIAFGEPADLTPLTALSGLTKLDLRNSLITDLSPLSALTKLQNLNLYGASVKDFSPLAACPALKELTYYGTKDADYATLGKLTQLSVLKGGLTSLSDISWIVNLKNLTKFSMFSEEVSDYTPLASLAKLEDLHIWKMKQPVGDLGFLKGVKSLKVLVLDELNGVSNFAALKGLSELNQLTLKRINDKDGGEVDLSFAAGLAKLDKLVLDTIKVSNFKALNKCVKLTTLEIWKVEGISSLAPVKGLAGLKYLKVTKGLFPDAELTGFANQAINITQR